MFKKLVCIGVISLVMVIRNYGNFSAFGHLTQRFINTPNASTFPFANCVCAKV